MADSSYTVERDTTIAAAPATVYPLLADFHGWQRWSPWEGLDPALQRTYSGPESGPGAVYAWSGNTKAGQGRMEITGAVPNDRVDVDLAFDRPFKSRSAVRFTLRPDGAGTHVTWSMTGPRPLAMRLLGFVLSMDKLLGKDFEKGLAQLKAAAEA
jgi:uncharacterized protein YndB with AHSA1/START domain